MTELLLNENELKLVHLTGCIESMSQAARLADALIEADEKGRDTEMWAAAYMMLVIQYCKPFKASLDEKRQPHFLDRPDYLSASQLTVHDRLIELRDRFIAHRDLQFLGQNVGYLTDGENAYPIACKKEHTVEAPDVEQIQELIKIVRENVARTNAALMRELTTSSAREF